MRLQEWLWRWGRGGRGNIKRAGGSGLNDYLKYIQQQSGPHFHKWNCSSFRAIFKNFVSQRDGLSETLPPKCPQCRKKTKTTRDLCKYKVHIANYSLLKASPGNLCPKEKIYLHRYASKAYPTYKSVAAGWVFKTGRSLPVKYQNHSVLVTGYSCRRVTETTVPAHVLAYQLAQRAASIVRFPACPWALPRVISRLTTQITSIAAEDGIVSRSKGLRKLSQRDQQRVRAFYLFLTP